MAILILVKGPTWANGCAHCSHGIVNCAYPGLQPMYIERAILAHHGQVTFCTCRAGLLAQQYARRIWRVIESGDEYLCRDAVAAVLAEAARMPTVHGPDVAQVAA